jgi:hypothetical protein
MNFSFQPPDMFVFFWFFTKMAWLKVVLPLKIYQHAKFYGPVLTGESFAPTSGV